MLSRVPQHTEAPEDSEPLTPVLNDLETPSTEVSKC